MPNITDIEKRVATGSEKIVMKPHMTVIPKIPTKTLQKMPIFITKNNKITLVEGQKCSNMVLKKIPLAKNVYRPQVTFREDTIYRSKEGDFLRGNPHETIVVMNRLDLTNNSCRTIAQYINHSDKSVLYEKTSDSITKLIGQDRFDTVLSALCSVINLELKVKGIMGLLVEDKAEEPIPKESEKIFAEKCCQTDVNCMELIYRIKQKKRIKRSQLIPYVVKDTPMEKKKVVVHPENAKAKDNTEDSTKESTLNIVENSRIVLPEIKSINEDSNASTSSLGNVSTLSGISANFKFNHLIDNPTEIFKHIDQCTATTKKLSLTQTTTTQQAEVPQSQQNPSPPESTKLPLIQQTKVESPAKVQLPSKMTVHQRVQEQFSPACIRTLDGSRIMVPVKPEDHFHIATPEILQNVTMAERKKLLWYQAYIDWKLCLHPDEDDNL